MPVATTAWTEVQVATGRKFVEQEAQARWQLGDLALEIAPAEEGGLHLLDDFAREIGIEAGTLRQYRMVSAAFPTNERMIPASWSVYREVMADPALAHALADKRRRPPKGRWTVDQVRELRGKAPRNELATLQQKAEVARKLVHPPSGQYSEGEGAQIIQLAERVRDEEKRWERDPLAPIDAHIHAVYEVVRALSLHIRSHGAHLDEMTSTEAIRMLSESQEDLAEVELKLKPRTRRKAA